MSRAKRIVICGGGAIGAAIAYFLSLRGAHPIVLERHTVAGSASGTIGRGATTLKVAAAVAWKSVGDFGEEPVVNPDRKQLAAELRQRVKEKFIPVI